MTQVVTNELEDPETLVLTILRRESEEMREIWDQIDYEMHEGMNSLADDLDMNWLKRGMMKIYWKYVSRRMLQAASQGKSLAEIEDIVSKITTRFANEKLRIPFQVKRAQRSLKLVQDYLLGPKILDYGCGDGTLATLIGDRGYDVITADVLDYRLEMAQSLPYLSLSQDEHISMADNCTNTTILWTVLHHCDNPESVFEEISRITSERIIIVEGYVNNRVSRLINCFYDWYANRPGKNLDINVPYAYKTTQEWHKLFNDHGWEIQYQSYLGIDEPVVPERHILFVLQPQSTS